MRKNMLSEIAAIAFILLFTYAAASKLIEYDKFEVQLGQSPLLTSVAFILVWLVPSIEIIISLLLAFQKTRMAGFYLSFILMLIFTGYIIVILYFSPYVPCSCGGVLEKLSWKQHLFFNIGFVLLSVTAVITYHERKKISYPDS